MQIHSVINTIKFLKVKQIWYQLYYRVCSIYERFAKVKFAVRVGRIGKQLRLKPLVPKLKSYDCKAGIYNFLNYDKERGHKLKLWRYNYYYMDYLLQSDVDAEQGLSLLRNFEITKEALEPYPISLRAMNWVKFLSLNNISDICIDSSLYAQYERLLDRIEYHLLGNHLLENGFSLVWGGFYFEQNRLIDKGCEIVCDELEEQILSDGAHFELSPMYHMIMLERLLDIKNLLDNNNFGFKSRCKLEECVNIKLPLMLGWLRAIVYVDNRLPMFNDSAYGISSTVEHIFDYAERLGVKAKKVNLAECGYRKLKSNLFEATVDVAAIGPSYIPGHAHADSLNFELSRHGNPFICDVGTSTYENNEIRYRERSTMAHNTVVVNNINSSDVWGAFRVGNRATTTILKDDEFIVEAEHNGYRNFGVFHRRRFTISDSEFKIVDKVFGKTSKQNCAMLHFAPGIDVFNIPIEFRGATKVEYFDYQYPLGYNKYVESRGIKVFFSNKLETIIH